MLFRSIPLTPIVNNDQPLQNFGELTNGLQPVSNDFISPTVDYSTPAVGEMQINSDVTTEQINKSIFPTADSLLKPNEEKIQSNINLDDEVKPADEGKFFFAPIEEEEDKNMEKPLATNPFEFNVSSDFQPTLNSNFQDQPELNVSLDTVSQFSDPQVINHPIQTENPVNQFGLPLQNNNTQSVYTPVVESLQAVPSVQQPTTYANYNTEPVQTYTTFEQPKVQNYSFNYTPENNIEPLPQPVIPHQPTVQPMVYQFNQPAMQQSTYTQPAMAAPNQIAQPIPQSNEKNINNALEAIKECVGKIKNLGFNVNTEDFDFENIYQIMFRIEK